MRLRNMIEIPKTAIVKFNYTFLLAVSVFTIMMVLHNFSPGDGIQFFWGGYHYIGIYLETFIIFLWSISVYIGLFMVLIIFARRRILIKTFTAGMLAIGLLSCVILYEISFNTLDALGGLIFFVLPKYQWLSLFLLLFVCAIVFIFSKN